MNRKKRFEPPVILTYRREELVVETVFTGEDPSEVLVSDRCLKRDVRPARGCAVLDAVLRVA